MTKTGNSQITRTITLLITIFSLSLPAYAKYSGGSGTADDPYQIATADDLMLLGETPDDYDKHFILTDDIDLDPNLPGRKVFDRAVIAPDVNDDKDRFQGTAFTGVFDGSGHTILNLTMKGSGFLGLFGRLTYGAEISNLGLDAVDVNGIGDHVGGLAGNCGGWGGDRIVTNCYTTGTVSGKRSVGGLVGCNGYFGLHGGGVLANCYSTGMVTGENRVGGLVGDNRGSIITSFSNGKVIGDWGVGGLIGLNGNDYDSGRVASCYSMGAVTGGSSVGGLVGHNGWEGSITRGYSTGMVTGSEDVGGLVGGNGGSVNHCVWDIETTGLEGGDVGVGLTTTEMMDPNMLGLNGFANDLNWVLNAGRDYPRLAWEGTAGELIKQPIVDWLEGDGTAEEPYRIYTADQLILLTKTSALWDMQHFVLGADIDLDPNLPSRRIFNRAVVPRFSGVFDGNGHTISNLTIIGGSCLGFFGKVGQVWVSVGEVKNLGVVDVNITGSGAGIGGLVGVTDRCSLTNCYTTGMIRGGRLVGGLVGENGNNVTKCYSCGMVSGREEIGGLVGRNSQHSDITASYSTAEVEGEHSIGGLVGSSYGGNITESNSTGPVSGEKSVGGLIGYNSGTITSSYNTGTVSGDTIVGGLAGYNGDPITASYSTGTVTGSEDVGGLVGANAGDITVSYSIGAVKGDKNVGGLVGRTVRSWGGDLLGSMAASFWDMETSGQTGSDGGKGKTTAEMQCTSTFLEAGWDFVDEVENGTEDIWWIDEDKDYPRLWWEEIEQ